MSAIQHRYSGGIDSRSVDRAYAAALARADLLELRLHELDAHILEARRLARQI